VNNRKLRLGFSLVAVASTSFAWACFSSNSSTSSSSTSSGTGSTDTSASTDTTGTSASSSSAASGALTTNDGPVLDDMTNNQPPTGGSWYTYSSRTIPNSEPGILTTDAGTLSPPEGAMFPFSPAGSSATVPALAVGDAGSANFREFSGTGIPEWGCGFGMDLTSALPDGGPVVLNACEAGVIFDTSPTLTNTGIPEPFDASAYAGFSFYAISLTGKNQNMEIHVDDESTTPWGYYVSPSDTPVSPQRCDYCKSSGTCSGSLDAGTLDCPCSDNFYKVVTFTTSWKLFTISFTDTGFTANHWSHEGALTFDPTHMYNIHFQDTISTGDTPDFDVAVAYLQWITK
jgi:hypothetical protein